MKETKVYVDELPESCINCPCCSCDLKPEFIKIGHFMYCNLLKQAFRFKEERKKLKDCPLIDIKTHDRELVKEVCEKIRKTIASTVDLAESNQQIKDQFHIILDQIQKEAENE